MLQGGEQAHSGSQARRSPIQLWVLIAFLAVLFMTGGSSQPVERSLAILRPLAVLVAAYAIFVMVPHNWRAYRAVLIMLTAMTVLTAIHLVPLPPDVWQSLPGRSNVLEVDRLTGNTDNWRPLSMVPEATRNALFSLSVPTAVALLMTQLGAADHRRVLLALIALLVVSGTVGLLQLIGTPLPSYGASDGAGLFANRNHQGVMLSLLLPLLAAFVASEPLDARKRRVTIISVSVAVIVIPLIVITGSRAGLFISVLSAFLVPFVLAGRRVFSVQNLVALALKTGGVMTLIAVLIGATVYVARDNALDRLGATVGEVRLPIWQTILDALPTYMPWGVGIGAFADVFQTFEPDSMLRPGFFNHAHNDYLELLFTAGVPAAIFLFSAIALFLAAMLRGWSSGGVHGVFNRLGLSTIIIFAAASAVDYPIRTPIISAVFVTAAVWASSYKRFGNEFENV